MNRPVRRTREIPSLAPRPPDAHKGSFGRVLVIGGSVGMAGAPSLVGLAALRSGAGLVTIATPRSVQPTVACLCPCATTIPLPQTRTGQLDPGACLRVLKVLGLLDGKVGAAPDALVIGPGLGRGSADYARRLWELIDAFGLQAGVPVVIDADALNLAWRTSAKTPGGWDGRRHGKTIITPHPGELARMHGVTARQIQADREGFAVRTARMMSGRQCGGEQATVVVLKGAGTIVTDGELLYVNRTGNPGMATGGSGDVLAGVIGALLGQKVGCFDAAVLGVYVHGLAGDLAAAGTGEVSLIASDIIEALPRAFLSRIVRRKARPARGRGN